jgi:hypothetical protein
MILLIEMSPCKQPKGKLLIRTAPPFATQKANTFLKPGNIRIAYRVPQLYHLVKPSDLQMLPFFFF